MVVLSEICDRKEIFICFHQDDTTPEFFDSHHILVK